MPSRRERYENANIRGGLGVRKRLSDQSLATTYRLNGVQSNAVIARTLDKYGRWGAEVPFILGVLVRKSAQTVYIRWQNELEIAVYSQGDARYEVDRGRWKVLGAISGDPMNPDDPLATMIKKLRHEADQLLTEKAGDGMIDHADAGDSPTEENDVGEMSNAAAERALAKKALANGDLKERETYTAKQVATRCGTDSKTMRKFFRSSHSTVEAVGQGGRYEFDAKDLPKIQREFKAWSKRAAERRTRPTTEAVVNNKKAEKLEPQQIAKAAQDTIDENPDDDISLDQLADAIERAQDEEPSDEDLAELADLDLDLDDLDAED